MLLVPVAGYLLVALASFDAADAGWSHSGSAEIVATGVDASVPLAGGPAVVPDRPHGLPATAGAAVVRLAVLRDPADGQQAADPLVPLTRLAGVVLALLGGASSDMRRCTREACRAVRQVGARTLSATCWCGSLGRGSTTMFALMMFLIGSPLPPACPGSAPWTRSARRR